MFTRKPRMKKTEIAVLIITYNSKAFIEDCIDSLLNSEDRHIRITVIDNASTDGTPELVGDKYPSVMVLRNPENIGYAGAVNRGLANSKGDFFVVANADVVFCNGAVHQMVDYLASHHNAGVVGAQQVFPDGRWQRSYGGVPGIWDSARNLVGITSLHNWIRRLAWPGSIDHPKEVGYIDGAAMAIRKEAYQSVGGFDEDFFFYAEEADFCFRLKKSGWGIIFLPSARITHIRGGSSVRADIVTEKYLRLHVDSKLLLFKKHYPRRQLYLYIQMERAHAKKLALIYKSVGYFSSKAKRNYVLRLASESSLLANIWGEQLARWEI